MTPSHLGGHLNRTWVDEGVLLYLKQKYNIKSMIDLGCGPGGMQQLAQNMDIEWHGIDGDPVFTDKPNYTILDFTKEKHKPDKNYDLCWSVEFLEHVEEEYIKNYLPVIKSAKYFLCTASNNPNGHNHVNVKPFEYWFQFFLKEGFTYPFEINRKIKYHSTMKSKRMKQSFMKQTGMFFINNNL